MDLWRKVLRSELLFTREETCRRSSGLITKSLKLQCCPRCSLPKMLSNPDAKKITEEEKKEKNLNWVAKTERPLTVCLTRIKNDTPPQTVSRKHQELKDHLFNEHLWGAVLVFQLFKQFDLKIRCFILKFQKLFSHGIFKNCFTVLHFSEFETNDFHLLRSFSAPKIVVFVVFCSLIFVLLVGFCLICVFVRSKSFRKNK